MKSSMPTPRNRGNIRWQDVGSRAYPVATSLLITAGAGGSNGYRSRVEDRAREAFFAFLGLGRAVRSCSEAGGPIRQLR